MVQNQVKQTLKERLTEVSGAVIAGVTSTRTAIAEELCERFGFVDGTGKRQVGSCLKALRELELAGHFKLPMSRSGCWRGRSPRRLKCAVAAPMDVPERVDWVQNLELNIVESDNDLRV